MLVQTALLPSSAVARTKLAFLVAFVAVFCATNGQEEENINSIIKVNAGGPELIDVGFLADEPYVYAESSIQAPAYEDISAPVVPIPWGEVYRTHRYAEGGTLSYMFPVPEGVFSVGLTFVEQYDGVAANGGRVFDLYINDVLLDQDIDIWTLAGEKLYEPYFLQKLDISPVDGHITISLVPIKENPMLSGIVIEGPNSVSILWKTETPIEALAITPATGAPIQTITPVAVPDPAVIPAPVVMEEPTAVVQETTVVDEALIIEEAPAAGSTASPHLSGTGAWSNVEYSDGEPVARHEACAVFADGLVYNIGGRGMKPVSVFNPVTGEWSRKTGPPVEVHHMQCVFYKNKIYIGASWFGEFPYENERKLPKPGTADVNLVL